ncbi:MAG TPA: RNHCP domain-containing protein [Spirochaetia bacterium]|nr:RNHCP domain-containing protein [Spirochaetia bacterium]
MSRYQDPDAVEATGTFHCIYCQKLVTPAASGTEQRNHCPYCLWSRHVDFRTGDRRSACRSAMEPIAVWAKPNGEWSVVHRCKSCGALRDNRIAGDDDELILLSVALKPLARPAFPLDRVARLGATPS